MAPNVNVSFESTLSGGYGNTLTVDFSSKTITANLSSNQFLNNGSVDLGSLSEILLHEAAGHGPDVLALGDYPSTMTQEFQTELNAYTLQQTFSQALDRTSNWQLWQQGWSLPANQSDAINALISNVVTSANTWATSFMFNNGGVAPPPSSSAGVGTVSSSNGGGVK